MRRNFFTIFKDLENLMNDDFLTDFNVTLKNDLDKNIKRYTSNRPLTNVYEDEWSFRYEIFTPGFLKKEISIEVKDGSIEVTGVLDKEDKGKSGDCIIKEFNLNKFYRNFVLPENVLLEEIHAKVENGITTIFVPKEKPTKTKDYSRKIKVE
jgi:HSP20 family protein